MPLQTDCIKILYKLSQRIVLPHKTHQSSPSSTRLLKKIFSQTTTCRPREVKTGSTAQEDPNFTDDLVATAQGVWGEGGGGGGVAGVGGSERGGGV